MPETFNLEDSARAMHAHTLRMVAALSRNAKPWRKTLVPKIEELRQEIREEECGGGMCHVVTEALAHDYGWERLVVTYLDPEGKVICAGHFVNALPNGDLIDPTADQMGEGHSVRLLKPTDRDYGRYRPEFDEDINPAVPLYTEFHDFYWNGKSDPDSQDEMRAELGEGWWLQDKTAYLAYLQEQVSLGGDGYRGWVQKLIAQMPQNQKF